MWPGVLICSIFESHYGAEDVCVNVFLGRGKGNGVSELECVERASSGKQTTCSLNPHPFLNV